MRPARRGPGRRRLLTAGRGAAKGREWSPSVSPDGRYLFFMASRATLTDGHAPAPLRYADLKRMGSEPGNGNPDIWWVSAEVVEALRPDGW